MSHIQSAAVDERGGFMRRQHPALKACVCHGGEGGGVKVCVQAETPYVVLRACQLHQTVCLLKSHILGRFKSANKTTMLSQYILTSYCINY